MANPAVQDTLKYSLMLKTIEQDAATSVYATLSPDVTEGGKYAPFPLFLLYFHFHTHPLPHRPSHANVWQVL
jgi:hypothetical protein